MKRNSPAEVIRAFVADESGATSIEYGMIAALVSVAIVSAATQLGTNVSNVWGKVANNMK
ncbi:MAG TPA: Flp family type IVb pilin [Hyphomicrobiaceae bacterium]|nr:Flp family type IVb pilin [Hyphomicrobiaceae bacterium]